MKGGSEPSLVLVRPRITSSCGFWDKSWFWDKCRLCFSTSPTHRTKSKHFKQNQTKKWKALAKKPKPVDQQTHVRRSPWICTLNRKVCGWIDPTGHTPLPWNADGETKPWTNIYNISKKERLSSANITWFELADFNLEPRVPIPFWTWRTYHQRWASILGGEQPIWEVPSKAAHASEVSPGHRKSYRPATFRGCTTPYYNNNHLSTEPWDHSFVWFMVSRSYKVISRALGLAIFPCLFIGFPNRWGEMAVDWHT